MTRAFVALAMSLLLLAPSRAWACSCVEPSVERRVVPADGATDFPIDGIVRVFLSGVPSGARLAIGAEYRLRDAAGTIVPLDASLVGTRLDLRPRARLSPSTTYTLEQVFAFDAAGTRLTDLERLGARGPMRGVWYPIETLRTASGVATPRAVAPTITATRLHFAHGGGDCGPATAMSTDLTLAPGALPTDVVELRVRSMGVVTSAPSVALTSIYVGDMLCDPDPVTLPAGAIEIQLALIDAAGTQLGVTAWTRSTGRGRRSPSVGRTGLPGTWPSVTIVAAPTGTSVRGPAACAHGLEVVSRHDVVPSEAPWMFGARTTIATDGGARWAAYSGGDGAPMVLYVIASDGAASRTATTVIGHPTATIATSTGPIVPYVTYTQDAHAQGHVARFDTRGSPAWSADLGSGASDMRIARGDGRVLLAYGALDASYGQHLAFALFDEQTGAAAAPPVTTTLGLDTNAEGPGAAFVDGHFLIVWPTGSGFRSGPLASAVVRGTTLGTPNDLSAIASYSPPDLVGAGTRAGLVTADQNGRVLFTVLDHDGRVAAGPFDVSTGVGGLENRLPRISWNGSLFAIAWETYPTAATWVAVADATGAVSAATRVDALEPLAGTIGIAPTTNGWLAGYTVDRAAGRIAELRCRSGAALGPPQTIGATAPPAP